MRKTFIILMITVISLSGCNINSTTENLNSTSTSFQENIVTVEKKQDVEQPIILYNGITLDTIDKDIDIDIVKEKDAFQKQRLFAKYEREYYLYSNNTFLEKTIGKIEERGLDYYWQVSFDTKRTDDEVAISQSYNPYPRKIANINSNFPIEFDSNGKVLSEINNKFDVNSKIKELSCIDLDGNGENEYIALFLDAKNNFFAKCLLNSKHNIIAYLTVFKEKCDDFDAVIERYNLLNSGEIIDINNDSVMEIIVTLPSYEGFLFKVFSYKNGDFDGDFVTKCSLQP